MTHQEKLDWMAIWCEKHGLALQLEGECGFGRECVGVLSGDVYPDYEWHDKDWNRADPNGDVWTPPSAYHKHPCVAVLGRGEHAEEELYQWLRWFDENNFALEVTTAEPTGGGFSAIEILFGKHENRRMVKK